MATRTHKENEAAARRSLSGTILNPDVPDVFTQAAKIVQQEKLSYETSSLGVRETIKRAYKNYLGVFDEPIDPYTGRRKIFSPLTHDTVDQVAKPVDVSSKSIKVTPLTTLAKGGAKIANMVLPYFFRVTDFDATLKLLAHRVAWLGSQVTVQDWYYEEIDVAEMDGPTSTRLRGLPKQELPDGRTVVVTTDRPRIRTVNLLDLYMPPTAESLSQAVRNASVILRSVVPLADVWGNPLYDEQVRSELKARTFLAYDTYNSDALQMYALSGYRNGEAKMKNGIMQKVSESPQIEVFDRYGMIPKSFITKDEKDALTLVPGIITVGCETSGGAFRTLSVRLSPFGEYGPFEEIHFNKVPNRWYGEGIGERLIPLQAWHNEVINMRRNNEVLVQNRMFVYKRGKVDPSQFMSRPGGGIAVESLEHIRELNMKDVSQSSFAEDGNILNAAQRLAGISSTPLSKRMTAAEVANIQANSNLTYSELREAMEKYVERVVNKHLLPMLARYYDSSKPIPIELEDADMELMDTLNGYAPLTSRVLGSSRYLILDDPSLLDGPFAVTADIEGALTSRSQQVQALNNAIMTASKLPQAGIDIAFALRKVFELSGLYDERLYKRTTATQPSPMGEEGTGVGQLSAGQAQPNAVAGGAGIPAELLAPTASPSFA
jgi:hypothetical protein